MAECDLQILASQFLTHINKEAWMSEIRLDEGTIKHEGEWFSVLTTMSDTRHGWEHYRSDFENDGSERCVYALIRLV